MMAVELLEYITELVTVRAPISEIDPIVLPERANQCVSVLAAHPSILVAVPFKCHRVSSAFSFASVLPTKACAPQGNALLTAPSAFLFPFFSARFAARCALAAHVAQYLLDLILGERLYTDQGIPRRGHPDEFIKLRWMAAPSRFCVF